NVAYHDFPFDHDTHDWNWDLLPDPAYQFLNGTDNGRVGSSRQMEIEWEEKFFPSAFRPAVGDRAWMLGRWVFDCGHSPYLTEIHPAKAVAHTRFAPTILPGDAAPSLTNKTFIWIHGRGGYYNRSVARQNYDFDVALPSRPGLVVQQNKASGAAVGPPVASRASGECRLRLFAGQQWTPLTTRVNSRLNDVDDGETVPLHDANDHRCAATFNITDPGGSVRIETTGWESDAIDGLFGSGGNILRLADDNDQI